MRTKTKLWHVVRTLLIGLLLFFLLLPILEMFLTSIKTLPQAQSIPYEFVPTPVHFSTYLEMWHSVPSLSRYIFNSVLVASLVGLFTVSLAIPASYVLARYQFPARRTILLGTLVINLFSPVIVLAPLYETMRFLGLLNTYWAMIIPTTAFALPFVTWLLTGFFQGIPVSLEEAAAVDGASKTKVLLKIVLPLAAPGLAASAMYAFITGWGQSFIFAVSFISDNSMMPVTQGLYKFFGRNEVEWNYLMGATLVSTVPIIIMFTFLQQYLIGGLTAGAEK